MGKSLDASASFQPSSLTFWVSKVYLASFYLIYSLFEEANSILSRRQASFRLDRPSLDRIPFLSPSISDGFIKPTPSSWTILAAIDFSKGFHSVWHPAIFHKFIYGVLLPCFVRWTQPVLFNKFIALYFFLFLSIIFLLVCLIFFWYSLYSDTLAIWFSSPSVPAAVEATK